jgi:hypothetical protein
MCLPLDLLNGEIATYVPPLCKPNRFNKACFHTMNSSHFLEAVFQDYVHKKPNFLGHFFPQKKYRVNHNKKWVWLLFG